MIVKFLGDTWFFEYSKRNSIWLRSDVRLEFPYNFVSVPVKFQLDRPQLVQVEKSPQEVVAHMVTPLLKIFLLFLVHV